MSVNRIKGRLLGFTAITGVAMCFAALTPVQAQDDTEEDRIVVTGSRIERPDIQSSSPISVVGQDDILLSGNVGIEEVLNELPQIAPSLTGTTNNGGTGAATVDLRALNADSGAQRTLVLVNGRRYLASDAEGRVDLNTIPSSLIERVDVVTGGASAIYGSDAIAGAVNFILRDDFEGVEASALYTVTGEGDGDTINANITMGTNFDNGRGNVVLFADYYNREDILAGAREFSDTALSDLNGTFLEIGSSRIPGGQIIQSNLIFPDGTTGNNAGFTNDGDPVAAPGTFNFQPDNYLQTPLQRFLIFSKGTYQFTDWFEGFTELTYANNQVDQQLAFDANDIPDGAAPLFVPLSNPLIAANPNLVNFLATNFDQGTNNDVTAGDGIATVTDFRRRMTEVGPRFDDRTFNSFRILLGGRGDLPDFGQGQDWGYEFYYSFATTNRTSLVLNRTSDIRIQQALFAEVDPGTGDMVCTDPTGGCVPIGLFGEGSISAEAGSFIAPDATEFEDTEQQIANIVVSGTLMDLPAGDLGVAFGFEYRDEFARLQPDNLLQTGELGPGNDNDPTSGSFDVFEFFGEALIPVVRDMPFVESLEIEGAFRVADYSTVGTNVSFKGGGTWTPYDGVKFRGLFQRAVRAPNVDELFQGGEAQSESATDICTATLVNANTAAQFGLSLDEFINFCQLQGVPDPGVFVADSQIFTITQGNPDLEEERANTITAGAVIQPGFIPGLSITADYFRISLVNAIDDFDADTTLGLCAEDFARSGNVNSPICQAVIRNPINGSISELNAPRVNLGEEIREGVDWQLDYRFALDDVLPFGGPGIDGATLRVYHVGTYFLKNLTQPTPTSDRIDCNGIFGGDCTGLGNFAQAKWRLTNNVDYAWDMVNLRAQVRIVGPLTNINIDTIDVLATPETDTEIYLDLAATVDITDTLQVYFGVNNVFDNEPPILGFDFLGTGGGADANTDPSLYDVLGRKFFLGGAVRF